MRITYAHEGLYYKIITQNYIKVKGGSADLRIFSSRNLFLPESGLCGPHGVLLFQIFIAYFVNINLRQRYTLSRFEKFYLLMRYTERKKNRVPYGNPIFYLFISKVL